MALIDTTVTYLEMTSADQLRATAVQPELATVTEVRSMTVSFYRYLYNEVGRQYHWVERRRWSDERLAHYLDDPRIRIWLLQVEGCPAGYFELESNDDGAVQIAYFGLLPEFVGRGLGRFLLEEAARTAWSLGASRVWLHTCTLDNPAALPNYESRGFVRYAVDTETIETIDE